MTIENQRFRKSAVARAAVVALVFAAATAVGAQQPAGSPAGSSAVGAQLARDQIAELARVQLAIVHARDSMNVRLAKSANKTAKAQAQLQDTLRAQIAEILHHGGLTEAEYRRRTYFVSTDTATRRVYDSVVVALTGVPLPGAMLRGMIVAVPAGPVGTHLGHVVNEFADTPGRQGLLGTALAEARIAAQHATLAARQPDNLGYLKTHAAHVIHALDPSVIAMGPGLGYGVRKAAAGVITHIELAAGVPGASPGIVTHSKHVAISARNSATRAEQLLSIAQKIQTAATAPEAAALVSQMASLADQLLAGADANGDGRITWEQGEGGLQHVDEHVKLMLRS